MKSFKVINNTGLFFPVYFRIIRNLDKLSWFPKYVNVAIYGDEIVVSLCGEGNLGYTLYTIKLEDYRKVIGILLKDQWVSHWESKQRDTAAGWGYLCQSQVLTKPVHGNPAGDVKCVPMDSPKWGAAYILYMVGRGVSYHVVNEDSLHLFFNDHKEDDDGEWI